MYISPHCRTVVDLGYLTAATGELHNRQGRAISGAITYAIEQINNCSGILPDVELKFHYYDTKGHHVTSAKLVAVGNPKLRRLLREDCFIFGQGGGD